MASSPLAYSGDSVLHGGSMGCVSCYDHEVKRGNQQDFGARCSSIGTERLMEFSFGMGSLAGAGSFGDFASMAKFVSSSRQELDITAEMGSSNSGAASVTKKRYTEERVGVNVKKSKQKSPTTSSPPKPEAPRVKLGDKITALQQIVSPFGKTDTASVLFETIKYIKFLHEQIQLFSEPYMTKNTYKGHIQFGAEEKGMTRTERDLRGRGLCLVPVSWTSQAYPDDTLPDCWTPAYRSCLYR
uniref:Uncharacterized protein n=1 Tax=Arundo donax TaxID=35708 RepID=A0A0A9QBT1_ARUDO